jgi:hypothetical protein
MARPPVGGQALILCFAQLQNIGAGSLSLELHTMRPETSKSLPPPLAGAKLFAKKNLRLTSIGTGI